MAKKNELVFDHDKELAALALWWKAIFLTPAWAFIVIIPAGALIRAINPDLDNFGFGVVIAAGLAYFFGSLRRRHIKISPGEFKYGFSRQPLAALEKVELAFTNAHNIFQSAWLPLVLISLVLIPLLWHSPYIYPAIFLLICSIFGALSYRVSFSDPTVDKAGDEKISSERKDLPQYPSHLKIRFANDELKIGLKAMAAEDLGEMLQTLAKRVNHLKISNELERYVASRKPMSVSASALENPDQIDLPYHSHRLAEELPSILAGATRKWARLAGPLGTLLICTPLWLTANFTLYEIGRDYSDTGKLSAFYAALVDILKIAGNLLGTGLSQIEIGMNELVASPAVLVLMSTVACALTLYGLAALVSPNRLTITRDFISLDFWSHLYSVTSKHILWSQIKKVELTAPANSSDPARRDVLFSGEKGVLLTIPMSRLDPGDRTKLLHGIEKFGRDINVQAELIEALTPSQDKSYTELWLQSLNDSNTINLEPLKDGDSLKKRYSVEKRLAVGGEGTAYLARDLAYTARDLADATGPAPPVVLKETLIPPYLDSDVQREAVERFEKEARLLKELKGDHVVGLLDYFIENKRCYLVLEYVTGSSLRNIIEVQGGLPLEKVRDLALQMARILSFLNKHGVVHRDFTPDNLILQDDGKLKLIDFNVASERQDGKTGTIVGKHAYVPPEQFRGKAVNRSDIYALGATLYFLITGRDPEPISRSSLDDTQDEVQAGGDCFELLNEIIKKTTALNQEARPDAEELEKLLEANGRALDNEVQADREDNIIKLSNEAPVEVRIGPGE